MLYTVRAPHCEVCDQPLNVSIDHSTCFERECAICECINGDHWTTNDGQASGCSGCNDCEGFAG